LDARKNTVLNSSFMQQGFRLLLSYAGSGSSMLAASASQLITFALLARYLGSEQFGLYAIITALTNVAVQLCGIGSSEALIRRSAQNPDDYPPLLGHTIILSVVSSVVLVIAGLIIMPMTVTIAPDPWVATRTSLLILISNIVLLKVVSIATSAYIAHSRFAVANAIEFGFAILRTINAVVACLVFSTSTVADWAFWHFGLHVVIAVVAMWSLTYLSKPKFVFAREEFMNGVFFSTQFLFKALRQNADLLVLNALAGAEIVGSYSVARRILESSYLAIEALNRLVYPGSAKAAKVGMVALLNRTRQVLLASLAVSTASALAIFVLAPLLPWLFGDDYPSLITFTRVLCFVLIPMAIYASAMEALGAAGRQGTRAAIFNTANFFGAGLVALMTWQGGINGTFASYYIVEIAIAIANWAALVHYARQSVASRDVDAAGAVDADTGHKAKQENA